MASSLTFSPRWKRHSNRWINICKSIRLPSLSGLVSALLPSTLTVGYSTYWPVWDAWLTCTPLQPAREEKDLYNLYTLGHFLKGSSATLGLTKVRDGCEKIQRYGKKENLDGSPEENEQICLERIEEALKAVKTDYAEIETVLRKYYKDEE